MEESRPHDSRHADRYPVWVRLAVLVVIAFLASAVIAGMFLY
jgi:type VI protein secretion system component VasF